MVNGSVSVIVVVGASGAGDVAGVLCASELLENVSEEELGLAYEDVIDPKELVKMPLCSVC
jgi:hypothetical protein